MALLVLALVPLLPGTASAAGRCAVLVREGTLETLVNRCGTCREVRVQRDRPGNGFPTHRTVMLREGGQAPLPFRGTGSTRILSDDPCEKGIRDAGPLTAPACIRILPASRTGPLLINECEDCRSASIETRERDGRRLTRSYSLAGKASIPFQNPNALDARILSQSPCKP